MKESYSNTIDRLSGIQKEILKHIIDKLTLREIAKRLDKSPHNILMQRKYIMRLLYVDSISEFRRIILTKEFTEVLA